MQNYEKSIKNLISKESKLNKFSSNLKEHETKREKQDETLEV